MNPGATLLAVATGRDGVYIGGNGLSSVNGTPRVGLAKLDPVTGQPTEWNPSPGSGVNSIYWRRTAVGDSVGPAAQLPTVLTGGSFASIGSPPPGSGQPARSKAAELEASDEGSVTPWDPSLSPTPASLTASSRSPPRARSSAVRSHRSVGSIAPGCGDRQ